MRVPRPHPTHSSPRCRHRARDRLHLILAAALLLAAITGVPVQARAQNRPSATDNQGPAALPATTALEATGRQFAQRSDLTAGHLLETARNDRAQGQPEIAQRILEVLIARFPESASALEAHRELYEIYGTGSRNAVPQTPSTASPVASDHQSMTARGPIGPALSSVAAGGPTGGVNQPWRTTVVSVPRLQDELRNGSGDRIFFGPGSAALGNRALAVLAAQATWLLARPGVEATIEGHADDAQAGSDDEQLAAARAAAVRDRLVAEGVGPERLQLSARGARDPIASCDYGACASQNRRIVVQVGVRQPQSPGNYGAPTPWPPVAENLRR
jgi:outer membrane protein OmpA-like peptidoglycan-associated protein